MQEGFIHQNLPKKLVNESKIFVFTNNSDLDKEKATLAIKAELKAEKDKIVKVWECYWSCFGGECHLWNWWKW